MLAANTLMALACLFNNKGTIDTRAIETQLTPEDKAKIQKYIDAGACLPASLEAKVKETEERIKLGKMPDFSADVHPTHDCD